MNRADITTANKKVFNRCNRQHLFSTLTIAVFKRLEEVINIFSGGKILNIYSYFNHFAPKDDCVQLLVYGMDDGDGVEQVLVPHPADNCVK